MMRRILAGALCCVAVAASGAPQRSPFDEGRMYRHGDGVAVDSKRAFALIERAARHGDAAAMFTLSNMLEAGEGAPRDRKAAQRWLEAAAQREFAPALQQLALYLQDGLMGYAADKARAAQLLRMAAHAVKH